MFTIVRKKFVRRKSYVEQYAATNSTSKQHRRSSSSSSIQNLASQKIKEKLLNRSCVKELSFEAYFRTNHPWQSVYVPQNVEKSLEDVRLFKRNLLITEQAI